MPLTRSDAWLTAEAISLIFLAMPLLILTWIELGRSLRAASPSARARRLVGLAFGVPQAMLGLTSAAAGLSLVGWVLYNSLVERQPQYTGGFLTFGIGPLLVVFGVAWLRDAFRRQPTPAGHATDPPQPTSASGPIARPAPSAGHPRG